MKAKTVEFLLDCYLKERAPDFEYQLEACEEDLPINYGFPLSHLPPVPRLELPSTGLQQGKLTELTADERDGFKGSVLPENIFSISYSPPQPILAQGGWRNESMPVAVDEVDALSPVNKRKCKEVARKLIQIADDFETKHHSPSLESELHIFLNSTPKDFTDEELEALRKIHSEKTFSVSKTATYLSECLTPKTFKGALQFLCYHCTSVPLEVALAFELSAQVIQRTGRCAPVRFIHSAIGDYFQSRADLEELQNDNL